MPRKAEIELTKDQKKLVLVWQLYVLEHDERPTYRVLKEELKVSMGTVRNRVRELLALGVLEKAGSRKVRMRRSAA